MHDKTLSVPPKWARLLFVPSITEYDHGYSPQKRGEASLQCVLGSSKLHIMLRIQRNLCY